MIPHALKRGNDQAEARDRDGERVEIDAVDGTECTLRQLGQWHAGLSVLPGGEQPLERADQEVTATARGIDELHGGQPVLGERRREGAIEDERLDKDGRLQQREALLGVLGQVLVQIAEEPRVALRVGEVEDGADIVGRVVERIPQADQPAR